MARSRAKLAKGIYQRRLLRHSPQQSMRLHREQKEKEASTRGTPAQGQRAFESEKAQMKEFQDYMKYVESQLSDNRGGKKR